MLRFITFTLLILLSSCTSETRLRSRVVKLSSDKGSCSGTLVEAPSGTSYILSASHCEGLAVNGSIDVTLDDTRTIPRRIIEVSKDTDLMLLEGLPDMVGIPVSDVLPEKGQLLTAYTHGLGLETYKSGPTELIQEMKVFIPISPVETDEEKAACLSKPKNKVQTVNLGFFSMSMCGLYINSYVVITSILPGSSGGGVFNVGGELVAVAFAGSSSGVSFLVTLPDIQDFLSAY